MSRPVAFTSAAPFVCSLLLLCAAPAFAEALPEAAVRVAASLARQAPQVKTLAVAPFKESGAAAGAGAKFADALSKALSAAKLQVRDWTALDQAARERALSSGKAPELTGVQALVVGEALGGAASAPIKIAARLVLVASGAVLATESATLGEAPQAAAPRPRNLVESASVDVAMRKIADQLVSGFASMPGNVRYRRLAVMPFSESGGEAKKRELGAVVTAELSTSLRRDHGLLLVERAKLSQVMGEIKLGQSGAVESSSAPEIGKLSDAQALVLGSVSEVGDRYLINARIISTETSESLASASEAVPAANLVSLSSDAVVLRSKKDAIFRSLLIPGWGQIYNREAGKGYLFMGAIGAAGLAGVAFQLAGASAEQKYKTSTPEQLGGNPADRTAAAAALRQTAESRYSYRNLSLAVGGGLWLMNILDAYFSGIDGDRLLGGPLSLTVGPGGVAGRF